MKHRAREARGAGGWGPWGGSGCAAPGGSRQGVVILSFSPSGQSRSVQGSLCVSPGEESWTRLRPLARHERAPPAAVPFCGAAPSGCVRAPHQGETRHPPSALSVWPAGSLQRSVCPPGQNRVSQRPFLTFSVLPSPETGPEASSLVRAPVLQENGPEIPAALGRERVPCLLTAGGFVLLH